MAKPTRYTPDLIEEYTQKGYWTPTTLSDLWDRNAERYPDEEAIADSETRLTWSQAKKWIDRLALGFLNMGIKKDELVVTQLPNVVELSLIRVASEKAGILCLPALPHLRRTEMEYLLGHHGAKGFVIPWEFRGFDYFKAIQEIRPNLPNLEHVFVVGSRVPQGAISINEMIHTPVDEKYPSVILMRQSVPLRKSLWFCTRPVVPAYPSLLSTPCAAASFQTENK